MFDHVKCDYFLLPFRCDADPSALAKYVVALVKKDKSEKDLKALCIDQLDVFLQKGKFMLAHVGPLLLCKYVINIMPKMWTGCCVQLQRFVNC